LPLLYLIKSSVLADEEGLLVPRRYGNHPLWSNARMASLIQADSAQDRTEGFSCNRNTGKKTPHAFLNASIPYSYKARAFDGDDVRCYVR
jgi:hypothetical protein